MPVVPSYLRYTRLLYILGWAVIFVQKFDRLRVIRVCQLFPKTFCHILCVFLEKFSFYLPTALKICDFKGTVQQDFRPSLFFHHSNQPEPRTNGLKYFRFWFRFRLNTRMFPNLRAASYGTKSIIKICGEISAQYDTAGSHPILRGVNSHFLNLLHRPLKGQCHKNNYEFLVW